MSEGLMLAGICAPFVAFAFYLSSHRFLAPRGECSARCRKCALSDE